MGRISAGTADGHGMRVVSVPASRAVAITVFIASVTAPVRTGYADLCTVCCVVMATAG